jgi:hypothetical protein
MAFEITLLSNGSMDIFPSNTMAKFSNLLPERLSLEGHWQVALSDLVYPASFYNIAKTKVTVRSYLSPHDQDHLLRVQIFQFPAGLYHGYDEIFETLKNLTGVPFTKFHVRKDRCLEFHLLATYGFEFSEPDIPSILGFPDNMVGRARPRNGTQQLAGKFPLDITGGRNLLFVYIDIIEHQIVGDSKAAMLRIIPLQNLITANGNLAVMQLISREEPRSLDYKKLLIQSFDRISVELRDETGRLLPFVGIGRTAIKLKFMKLSD